MTQNREIFEELAGPMTIHKMVNAYRSINSLTKIQLEKKMKHKIKKKYSLKEAVTIAKKLHEDQDFYAMVWFHEEARDAGLDPVKYFKKGIL